jgi:monothiol glutaredoxin
MTRPILDEQHLHPAIRTQVSNYQHDILQEVQTAITKHKVTVVVWHTILIAFVRLAS